MARPPNLFRPHELGRLRLVVGAAGERYGWWRTQFTKPVGRRMPGQLFPRTSGREVTDMAAAYHRSTTGGPVYPYFEVEAAFKRGRKTANPGLFDVREDE